MTHSPQVAFCISSRPLISSAYPSLFNYSRSLSPLSATRLSTLRLQQPSLDHLPPLGPPPFSLHARVRHWRCRVGG